MSMYFYAGMVRLSGVRANRPHRRLAVCGMLAVTARSPLSEMSSSESNTFCNIIIDGTWRRVQARVGWERILRLYYDSLSPTGTRQQRGSGRAHTPGPPDRSPHARGEGARASRENPNLETWVSIFTFTKWRRASPPDHSSANSWRQTLTLGRQVMA